MPGPVLADADFTKAGFLAALQKHPPVVHIASHFVFQPGDASRSFLLLGDGTPFTLSEMKEQSQLFAGTELLALSACRTGATQADANGREIDGFAELAQRLGAGAVLASLWPVADESTALLMAEFYRIRMSDPKITKAAALQMAQLNLLNGKLRPTAKAGRNRDTIVAAGDAQPAANSGNAPLYVTDPKRPYAHPYYWAPFVLYGNWR